MTCLVWISHFGVAHCGEAFELEQRLPLGEQLRKTDEVREMEGRCYRLCAILPGPVLVDMNIPLSGSVVATSGSGGFFLGCTGSDSLVTVAFPPGHGCLQVCLRSPNTTSLKLDD